MDYAAEYSGARCEADNGELRWADSDPLIAAIVADRYQIESRIGSGGFSTVYMASDLKLKRQVAIKLLHAFLQDSEELMRRFKRETELTARLQHPNLAVIYDSGALSNGQPYIAMEYLRGEMLEDVIAYSKRLPVARTVNIIAQVCDGLGYAHRSGVIHRDLTPRNIYVLDDDSVKIIDFGLAFSFDQSHSLTSPGDLLGTPQFMSPEQCRGESIDRRADIYSLGLIMQYMLSGVKPVDGNNLFEVVAKQTNETPKPLSEVCPELYFPAAVRQAIEGCIAKDRNDRFSDCSEVKQLIQSYRDGDSASAVRLPVQSRVQGKGAAEKPNYTKPIVLGLAGFAATVGLLFYCGETYFSHFHKAPQAVQSTSTSGAPAGTASKPPAVAVETKQQSTQEKQEEQKSTPKHPIENKHAEVQDSSIKTATVHPAPTKAKPVQKETSTKPVSVAMATGNDHSSTTPTHTDLTGKVTKSQHAQHLHKIVASGVSQKLTDEEARIHKEAVERVREAKERADKAFDAKTFDVALMLYREVDRDLESTGYKDPGSMLICKMRVLRCLHLLHKDSEAEGTLNATLAIMSRNLERTVKVINSLKGGCLLWNQLGNECYAVAVHKDLDATRADYLVWAESFYKLSYDHWNKPKDIFYRRMLGNYCKVLRGLGKTDEFFKLQAEDPIIDGPEVPTPGSNPAANPAAAPPPDSDRPRVRRIRKSGSKQYIRNYHFN